MRLMFVEPSLFAIGVPLALIDTGRATGPTS